MRRGNCLGIGANSRWQCRVDGLARPRRSTSNTASIRLRLPADPAPDAGLAGAVPHAIERGISARDRATTIRTSPTTRARRTSCRLVTCSFRAGSAMSRRRPVRHPAGGLVATMFVQARPHPPAPRSASDAANAITDVAALDLRPVVIGLFARDLVAGRDAAFDWQPRMLDGHHSQPGASSDVIIVDAAQRGRRYARPARTMAVATFKDEYHQPHDPRLLRQQQACVVADPCQICRPGTFCQCGESVCRPPMPFCT